jgi:hypothetical protein
MVSKSRLSNDCKNLNNQDSREGGSVLSREPHLNRSPTQGQNVSRGGQSIDTPRARSLLARVRAGGLPR